RQAQRTPATRGTGQPGLRDGAAFGRIDNRPWGGDGVQVSTDRPSHAPRIVLGILAAVPVLRAAPTVGCDVCAIYTATEVSQGRTGFRAGVGQQFTPYLTEQVNGEELPAFPAYLNTPLTH